MSVQTRISVEKFKKRNKNQELKRAYQTVRSDTIALTEPLETEDLVIQAMENTSPAKWHLAHTTWFFEAFVLRKAIPDYESMHPQYHYLFNSYYVLSGEPHCRDKRGYISRPTVKEVMNYRQYVDKKMVEFISGMASEEFDKWEPVITIGLNHEQQHQELILTDLKYMFSLNPLFPQYVEQKLTPVGSLSDISWIELEEGVYEVGHPGGEFGYDNEFPRHKTYIQNCKLADRLVTNGEFLKFMDAGGYENTKSWLDEGASIVKEQGWKSPLYWYKNDDEWHQFTLHGIEKLDLNAPVCHVSYYEADAYARWAGCRLPTEQEWETASANLPMKGSFLDQKRFHPAPVKTGKHQFQQMFGEAWQWTQSAYSPYPGYKPFPGALGEYNGKFMCNQYVLRGGSCATPKSHFRKTYRNFFHADARWQFSGIRLARDNNS